MYSTKLTFCRRCCIAGLLFLAGCSNNVIVSEKRLLEGPGARVFPDTIRLLEYSDKKPHESDEYADFERLKDGSYQPMAGMPDEGFDYLFWIHPLEKADYVLEFKLANSAKSLYYYAPLNIENRLISTYDADFKKIAFDLRIKQQEKIEEDKNDGFVFNGRVQELERLLRAPLGKMRKQPIGMIFDLSVPSEKRKSEQLLAEGRRQKKAKEEAKAREKAK